MRRTTVVSKTVNFGPTNPGLNSIYHMTGKIASKCQDFAIRKRDVFMDVNAYITSLIKIRSKLFTPAKFMEQPLRSDFNEIVA